MRTIVGRVFAAMFTMAVASSFGADVSPGAQTCPWRVQRVERQVLVDGIAYYHFDVIVGLGAYDRIRIHRVVKERHPYQPEHLAQAVMFFPGSPTYFVGLYIPPLLSQVPARDRSIAIFLAKNGIDVWGMDYRWALVPENTTDFSFMKRWGVSRDVEDAQIALTIAREMRGDLMKPAGQLFLTGLSYGAIISYAVAADDSQRPSRLRNVKGIIPLDCGVKFDDAAFRSESCTNAASSWGLLKSGNYSSNTGVVLTQIGTLGLSSPADPSPFDPSGTLNNYQFAIVAGASPNDALIPWHFVGSYLGVDGIPYDLRFTETRVWLDLLAKNEPPYYPVRQDYEQFSGWCGNHGADVTWDVHLGDITVPILYVGAAGGFGHSGDYSPAVTASHDVTIHIVQLLSDAQRSEDYGHGDLVEASNAEILVWQPVLAWIKAHK
jgi:hypothetical protein